MKGKKQNRRFKAALSIFLALVLLSMIPATAKYVSDYAMWSWFGDGTVTIVLSNGWKKPGHHHLSDDSGYSDKTGVSITSVTISAAQVGYYAFKLRGADGGCGGTGGPGRGGYGGTVQGFAYLTADTYYLVAGAVGSNGQGGYYSYYHGGKGNSQGGGGGGLSGIFKNSITQANAIAVAGGGGGGCGGGVADENHGGDGGSITDAIPVANTTGNYRTVAGEAAGLGGMVYNGKEVGDWKNGAGGGMLHARNGKINGSGNNDGDPAVTSTAADGAALQGGNANEAWGGGGGGGYRGGGAGGRGNSSTANDGGGGGGSSYIRPTDSGAFTSLPNWMQNYVNTFMPGTTTNSATLTSIYTDTVSYDNGTMNRSAGYVYMVYLGPNHPVSTVYIEQA
jgi:hypothetical protein